MDFKNITKALASHFEIANLEPDEDGLLQLDYDERVTVTALSPPESDALYLTASLMEMPSPTSQAFLERLLKMNFLLLDTRGAALSLDDDSRQVHLCICLPFALLDDASLPKVVGGFLETAILLQSELLAGEVAVSADGGSTKLQLSNMQRI